ncbi:M81 family metallopeptidase [Pseudactinotalea suaedae]|uniref:M81 family metallopeptidase n=1 Tax=Pseudactinotalea suaedae TaxID=1524924 RepID=UPI0012E258EC|nr:M81 family metallopeptidase [Pseudactinotalea suaedae]
MTSARPRIAVGGIYHETNTFAVGSTGLDGFAAYQHFVGEDLRRMAGTRSETGGFLTALERAAATVVPTAYAAAVPSATVTHADYEVLRDAILTRIAATPVDGVLLTLHGAMVTDGSGDPDGDLVQAVRELVGPDVPIAVTIDLHANVSDAMASGVQALVAYDTYPHIDMYERGQEAADLLLGVLRTGQPRSIVHRKLPFMTAPGMQATDGDPMRDLISLAHRIEREGELQVSLAPGFSYADVDATGFSVIVSGADQAAVAEAGATMAAAVDAAKERFVYEALSVAEACDLARGDENRPVILVDAADNIGGGAPGDGTAILEQWLTDGGTGLVVTIADPESVERAIAVGPGASVQLELGAKTDDAHGTPVSVEATVLRVTDGRYRQLGTYNRGYEVSMGRTVVLDVAGNTVVVSELKAMPFDAQQLISQGIEPAEADAIVVKSAIAWRAAYGDVAGTVLEVDTPGICTSRLDRLSWSPARAAMLPHWTLPTASTDITTIHEAEDA